VRRSKKRKKMRVSWILATATVFPLWKRATAFQAFPTPIRPSMAVGAGFGSSGTTVVKKKNSKKKTGSASNKRTATTPFDASASLIRMEKVYDELSQQQAKRLARNAEDDYDSSNDEVVTTEYVITTRCRPQVADWVPVAQMIVSRPLSHAEVSEGPADPILRAAVSTYCRELSQVAGMGSRVFANLPRQEMQYALEPTESFNKHVYDTVMKGKNDDSKNDEVMTKICARQVLQLEDPQAELSEIKRSYRKLSMAWHPDRFIGESDETRQKAVTEYGQIKLAYETLQSGVRNGRASWYESLGGRARTDFKMVNDLQALQEAADLLTARGTQAAVCGLDPEMVQTFVARSSAR
jgi:hypothetical protein